MNPEQIKEMNSIQWWHRIELEPGLFTPGICDHTAALATNRFGMPQDLTGKTVLDIGAWDGLFSFEAEKRGALLVQAIDTIPKFGGNWGGTKGFEFAKEYLKSEVHYNGNCSVYELTDNMTKEEIEVDDTFAPMFDPNEDHSKDFDVRNGFDVVLFYGVLYHLKDPVEALRKVCNKVKPGGFALIETAYHKSDSKECLWEYAPGHNSDDTNYWYPTLWGLLKTCGSVGFRKDKIEILHQDDYRITVKAHKNDDLA
jgi:tRNA (mo5U34)-methyltransferase